MDKLWILSEVFELNFCISVSQTDARRAVVTPPLPALSLLLLHPNPNQPPTTPQVPSHCRGADRSRSLISDLVWAQFSWVKKTQYPWVKDLSPYTYYLKDTPGQHAPTELTWKWKVLFMGRIRSDKSCHIQKWGIAKGWDCWGWFWDWCWPPLN